MLNLFGHLGQILANNVDPDQTLHSAASDDGLNYLLRPICPNTWGYYDNQYLTK